MLTSRLQIKKPTEITELSLAEKTQMAMGPKIRIGGSWITATMMTKIAQKPAAGTWAT